MAISRDISRTRKAYSYYRPRPIMRSVTTEEEMISINAAINSINSLSSQIALLQANSDSIVWNETPSGNVDGSNKVFTLAYAPHPAGKILVFVNGVLKEQDAGEADYSITGQTLTFVDPPHEGSKIFVTYAKNV